MRLAGGALRREPGPGCATLAALLCVAGCAQRDAASDDVERFVSGDTTIVRNRSPAGLWGDTMTLDVELEIGTLDGPPETTFGRVVSVTARDDGSILIIDAQGPEVREFDANGSFVRRLGGAGDGPGEYRRPAMLRAMRDGSTVLVDGAGRLHRYARDGTPLGSWLIPYLRASFWITADSAHVYVPIFLLPATGQPPAPGNVRYGYVRLGPDGEALDTMPAGGWVEEVDGQTRLYVSGGDHTKDNFTTRRHAIIDARGRMVSGQSDSYRLDVTSQDAVLRIERVGAAPPIVEEEMREWRAHVDFLMARRAASLASLPPEAAPMFGPEPWLPESPTKPFFRSIFPGEEGRIWVHRYVRAVKEPASPEPRDPERAPPITWREPNHFDVFEPDGTFLGTVVVPDRYLLFAWRGDMVWGVHYGELDVPFVFRARLVAQTSTAGDSR